MFFAQQLTLGITNSILPCYQGVTSAAPTLLSGARSSGDLEISGRAGLALLLTAEKKTSDQTELLSPLSSARELETRGRPSWSLLTLKSFRLRVSPRTSLSLINLFTPAWVS